MEEILQKVAVLNAHYLAETPMVTRTLDTGDEYEEMLEFIEYGAKQSDATNSLNLDLTHWKADDDGVFGSGTAITYAQLLQKIAEYE